MSEQGWHTQILARNGKTVLLDIDVYVKREVHQHAIECDTDEGNAEEFPHLPLLDFQPIEIEQDTEVHAGKRPHILQLFGQLLQPDDFAVEYLFHRVFSTESEFGKEGDEEDGNNVATCKRLSSM